ASVALAGPRPVGIGQGLIQPRQLFARQKKRLLIVLLRGTKAEEEYHGPASRWPHLVE
ncbi:uncharacterized protein METZ01_LOCUS336827, partial [marine metagenome]